MSKIFRIAARLYKRFFKPKEMESVLLRKLYRKAYDIDVGMYSYGCFDRDRFGPGMKVGRYCSFSDSCRRFNANHGVDYLMLHPYVYNPKLGMVPKAPFPRTKCEIAEDVWVGHNAAILPSVQKIGRGAVIAAGAVVAKDIPPYSVVAGVPARVVKMRFPPETIAKIEASRWWEMDKAGIARLLEQHPEWIHSPDTLPGERIQ